MPSTKLYFDTRQAKPGQPGIVKIAISLKGKSTYISLDAKVLPSQWDKNSGKVIKHPDKIILNAYINEQKAKVDSIIIDLTRDGKLRNFDGKQLRDYIVSVLKPDKKKTDESLFITKFNQFIENKKESTREVYEHTLKRITSFLMTSKDDVNDLRFEDITIEWLNKFNTFMAATSPSPNARNIHFRNLRAVFNYAIECDVTNHYPFRKFKIKAVETEKRSLTVEELRTIIYFPCEPHQEKYLDVFKLSFFLMGVNIIDLAGLTEIKNGRLVFNRSKTGHLYSMKIEPEAEILLEKHKGTDHLLFILDHWSNDEYFRRKMNKELQKLGPVEKKAGRGGKKLYSPLFPNLTSYWARHTWATVADELDIPDKIISEALGHEHGNRVTNIYIRKNIKKVDIANRKVLDWVLYGKRDGQQIIKPGTPEFFGMESKRAVELGLCK